MAVKGCQWLFWVTGVCSLLNGAGYLFIPKLTLGILGVFPNDFGLMITRYYGACAMGWGLILVLAFKTENRYIKMALLWSILITLGPSALVGALGVMKGFFNSFSKKSWSLRYIRKAY